ncbi:MAG TPA: hypothetical protein VH088_19845 [Terriglobales bacterium]|jgi:hypothetical protein|nr:hypothetical protein [Terriglobales bacterium]
MSQAGVPLGFSAPQHKPKSGDGLLTRVMEMFCAHTFSWPHVGTHGQDYQVCTSCGATYAYDWTTMRRTGRIAKNSA